MENNFIHSHTMAGTGGGILLVLICRINSSETLHTALLAAIGATVSFLVSVALKWGKDQFHNKQKHLKQKNGNISKRNTGPL